jgi:competence protein ComEC
VEPELVIFSHGRRRHGNPRPEIVAAIRNTSPTARIACTQLSTHCASKTTAATAHLVNRPAAGLTSGSCCAGTVTIPLDASLPIGPAVLSHQQFIAAQAPSALCVLLPGTPLQGA